MAGVESKLDLHLWACRGGLAALVGMALCSCAGQRASAQLTVPPTGNMQQSSAPGAAPGWQDQRLPTNPRVRLLQPGTARALRTAQAKNGAPPKKPPQQLSPRVQISPPNGSQPGAGRLPLLPELPAELGDPPSSARVQKEYNRFVEKTIDPEMTLDLMVGRPRILVFRETPTRIYLAQESVASYDIISDTEIAVVGVAPGRAVLTVWVEDPEQPGEQQVLSFLLRVSQDPGFKIRLEAAYEALEKEINQNFPDSYVKLSLIGDQLIVQGQAKDVVEAAQILKIAAEHAPPSRRQQDATEQPTNLSISQTAFSPQGVLQAREELGFTLDRLISAAGLEGEANVVNLLRIPGEQQVMLRVTVAEVNRSALRSVGTNLRIQGTEGVAFDSAFPPRVGDLADTTLMALEGGTLSVARGDFRLTVDALKQHNLARTLAEPNLVGLHGRPASFQAGGQFPVPAARVGFGSAAQGVEFVPFGVQLQFVPYIVDRDKIRLTVAAAVSTRDENLATNVDGSNVPGLSSRTFQNTVELRDGQTLAVAGLIQTNFGANSSGVPWLGDLPVVGRLFTSAGTTADEQELVILITPELVHPVDPHEILSLPGSDVFEPGDFEFYVKGFLESRRDQDFRSPVRTDWARLKRYRRCEDTFILGPSGHSYGCRDQALPGGALGFTPAVPAEQPRTGMEALPPPDPVRHRLGE